jgi:hypothetical protein
MSNSAEKKMTANNKRPARRRLRTKISSSKTKAISGIEINKYEVCEVIFSRNHGSDSTLIAVITAKCQENPNLFDKT